MKKKEKEELRTKTAAELEAEILKRQTEITKIKMEMHLGKVKNTSILKKLLDEVAVLKTILKEKELLALSQEKK